MGCVIWMWINGNGAAPETTPNLIQSGRQHCRQRPGRNSFSCWLFIKGTRPKHHVLFFSLVLEFFLLLLHLLSDSTSILIKGTSPKISHTFLANTTRTRGIVLVLFYLYPSDNTSLLIKGIGLKRPIATFLYLFSTFALEFFLCYSISIR